MSSTTKTEQSGVELKAAQAELKQCLSRFFIKLDKDKSGTVSKEEVAALGGKVKKSNHGLARAQTCARPDEKQPPLCVSAPLILTHARTI
jgi:hypothetical protein